MEQQKDILSPQKQVIIQYGQVWKKNHLWNKSMALPHPEGLLGWRKASQYQETDLKEKLSLTHFL